MVKQATGYSDFAESHRTLPAGVGRTADVASDEMIEVSVYLRCRPDDPTVDGTPQTREHLRAHRTAGHAEDIRLLREFATANGLTVREVAPARRLVKLAGPAAKMEAAFHTKLAWYTEGAHRYRGRGGVLSLPEALADRIESVLGLDTRPAARPKLVRPRANQQAVGYRPNEIGRLYGFPTGVTGRNETIGLIELGGGYKATDTQTAFAAMGLPVPQVVAVPVDGAINDPSGSSADGEVALDIQVAGGVAPGARIAVYFTPNTDAGFADALSAAVHDESNTPTVLSISWGAPEVNWTQQAMQTMNSLLQDAASLNIAVFVAAGDSLATDGVNDGRAHVDFPASSPTAIGCGGTVMTVQKGTPAGERVWNDGDSGTGGGISDAFDVPAFQASVALPPSVNGGRHGRGVPDVAGVAAPESGYLVVVNGETGIVGGTSAVAPLWAGLIALINAGTGRPVGFFLPSVYDNTTGLFRAVTEGTNRPSGSKIGYEAGPGWNACTGLGSPKGDALATTLGGERGEAQIAATN